MNRSGRARLSNGTWRAIDQGRGTDRCPAISSRGPSEGQRWVYFLAPWGLQFELVSYPHGKAFDRDPTAFA